MQEIIYAGVVVVSDVKLLIVMEATINDATIKTIIS
jgi:hypothetical protein